ncbi:MAG TPA: glycosyltransferase family 2 protein, partial [Chroococcales cyanobacterium]
MAELSVVIVAKNEERTIGQVLAAVKEIADEVIFVDSGSTDRTLAIVTEHGVKPIHQDWLGYAAQKNFAMGLARHEWLLSLDADEVVTEPLAAEIKQLLSAPSLNQCAGYKIPRILYIGSTPVMHGGFYP